MGLLPGKEWAGTCISRRQNCEQLSPVKRDVP